MNVPLPDFCRAAWDRARSADYLRIGLVAGVVVGATASLATMAYLHPPGSAPAADVGEEQRVAVRVPRPRPDEPHATGSINPRSVPSSAARDVLLPQPAVAAADESNLLRDRAALLAGSSSDCDSVADADMLGEGDPSGATGVVRVRCRNGARFYLDRDAIEANRVASADPAETVRVTDAEAVLACEDSVRSGLPLPASLQRPVGSTEIYRGLDDEAVVTFHIDALNGLGFPLSFRVHCVLDQTRVARLEISPR